MESEKEGESGVSRCFSQSSLIVEEEKIVLLEHFSLRGERGGGERGGVGRVLYRVPSTPENGAEELCPVSAHAPGTRRKWQRRKKREGRLVNAFF